MIRVPFWIPIIAIVAAHASGAINIFTTGAQILTGVDATVNSVIDFRKWAPQIKEKLHANKNSVTHAPVLPQKGVADKRDAGIGRQ